MLKRPFQSSLPSSHPLPPPTSWVTSQRNATEVGHPQPINRSDHHKLVKLSNPKGTVCVSDWSGARLEQQINQLDEAESPTYQPAAQHKAPDPEALGDKTPKHKELQANMQSHRISQSAMLSDSDKRLLSGSADTDDITAEQIMSDRQQLRQLKQYVHQQRRLRQVERKIRQTLDPTNVADTAVVEAAAFFNATQVGVLCYDPTSQTFEQVARYCQREAIAWQPALQISQGNFSTCLQRLQQGKHVCIQPDQLAMEKAAAHTAEQESAQWLAHRAGSWLFVPVQLQPRASDSDERQSNGQDERQSERQGAYGHASTNQAMAMPYGGILALALPPRAVWPESAIAAAESIALELSLALKQSQQYQALIETNQDLQKLALSDGLTSLANRRRFDEHLDYEWQRLVRDKQPLSLILCDLDHFKRYNDTFGHPAGDRCLIRVARALLNGPQRPADLVARYGGEEFAIILPNTDTHGAWRIAQKIHDSIRALKIDHAPDNEEPYVTVTMGVSTIIPGHDNSAQMLVQASDLALYHAKKHGRNRTYINGHYNTVSPYQSGGHQATPDALLKLMPQ
ncbi:MAG: diguanylate cyclase [Cyanobacteria bacterium J06607_10]